MEAYTFAISKLGKLANVENYNMWSISLKIFTYKGSLDTHWPSSHCWWISTYIYNNSNNSWITWNRTTKEQTLNHYQSFFVRWHHKNCCSSSGSQVDLDLFQIQYHNQNNVRLVLYMKHKMNYIRLVKGMIMNDYLKKIRNMKFMLASRDEIV
jgi:hypothetical protein